MTYFFIFLGGMAGGVGLVWLFVQVLKSRVEAENEIATERLGKALRCISDAKLAKALKRFGQIANRESIGEARKIANIALKELGK